ncbi:MAG: molybdate ABC transporter substrate-binding protein [Luteolibacter sp.]
MTFRSIITTFALCAFLSNPSHAEAPVLRVSAAASLAEVLKEIDTAFEKSTGTKVELNLGASSTLARQIEEGAPADVFFSADLAKMDGLEKKGLIDSATKEEQLSNSLVVVEPVDSNLTVASAKDLVGVGKIALADPKAVPAGIYAKAWLEKLGLWTQAAPKVVATENVRAALAAVEAGNVDAGVVYKTDAVISKKVKVAYQVPAAEMPPIVYPMAVLKGAANAAAAKQYLEFLDAKDAIQAFEKYGFVVLPEAPAVGK